MNLIVEKNYWSGNFELLLRKYDEKSGKEKFEKLAGFYSEEDAKKYAEEISKSMMFAREYGRMGI